VSVLPRDLVRVRGPDAFAFLQSLVSQDLDGIGDGEVRWSLLLTPQGKLDSAFRVLRVGDDAWLDVEAGWGQALATSIGRYRIRVRAEVEAITDGWGLVAWRGTPPAPGDLPAGVHVLPPWAGGVTGVDVVGPGDRLGGLSGRGLDAAAFERERVEAGVPALGAELTPDVIPQEAGLERRCVSFTKGCFLGQELVCRIDARGRVRRRLRHLRGPEGVGLTPGAALHLGDREVGRVTSAVPGLALGYVRAEVAPGRSLAVDGIAGTVDVAESPAL
jgi:folate-binding protein YgfZ